MIIVWDEPKRLANIEKYGIDFADISEAFFLSALIRPASDGRYAAIGQFDGVTVVMGSEALSIISARRANRRERSLLK